MNSDADIYIPPAVKAVIRYVLNPTSKFFNPSDLKWRTLQSPMVVYRGQCDTNMKHIPITGNNPLELSTAYGKPISTSVVLTDDIRRFACKPNGRLFKINLLPGIRVARLRDSLGSYDVNKDEAFVFLKRELPNTSLWNLKSLGQLRASFFSKLKREQEVLVDPTSGIFRKETGDVEDWSSPEADFYETGFFPKKAGRRRTLRSNLQKHSRRRSKWTRTFS